MAEVDHLIAQWISYCIPYLVALIILLWIIKVRGKDIIFRCFAYNTFLYQDEEHPKMAEVMRDFLSGLSALKSHDPDLRLRNAIRVLEIGIGTGMNFRYYPDGTHLIAVDANPHFKQYYDYNRKKYPNIHSEELIITTGEKLAGVEEGSVDAVVMTKVTCSVKDLAAVLSRVKHVLTPGGKCFILEHIKEFNPDNHWIRSRLQEWLMVTRVWPFLFNGCRFDPDCLEAVERAGFSKVEAERFYAPYSTLSSPVRKFILNMLQPSFKAVATK